MDTTYTARIRELTPTDPTWKFTTELVDHLPASGTVPTPLKVLGYVPGTVGKLSHVADINRYFRVLAEAAPARTRLASLGMSDENREELVLAAADEETIRRLDDYRAMTARLADPRGLSPDERARLIREAKPIYWLLGSIHAPETGSPEMLMELAYRLAVDDGEFVKGIRANVITLITPVQEVDGRDRMVDVYNQSKMLKVPGRSLVYWGKYTAHDNNRDGMVVSQKITQNYLRGLLHWRPTITHDLHESVPFLYISTGTGPYNDEFDPITIAEWHTLAYQEITDLVNLFRLQAAEIHEASSDFSVERGPRIVEDRGPLPASTSGATATSLPPARSGSTEPDARGAVFRGEQVTASSPILYGYDNARTFPVYFNQTPLLQVQSGDFGQGGGEAVGSSILAAQARARPRVILRFLDRADSLGISGMLNNPQDLQGKAAVIDAPLGNGHVMMFAIRPFWRSQTQGSWALALNAIANWNSLTDTCATTRCAGAATRVTDAAGAGTR